jgi:hypothetical protein
MTKDTLNWRTYSGSGGTCVAFAELPDGGTAVRHSQDPDGPQLRFTADEWRAFIAGVRGEADG